MDNARNLLERIQTRLQELNKAERKVAEVILQSPEQATRYSIALLAQTAQVSEPTINRFCRSFGISGYPELKLQLAQSLASGAAYVSCVVAADDNPEAYTRKIFCSTIASRHTGQNCTPSSMVQPPDVGFHAPLMRPSAPR